MIQSFNYQGDIVKITKREFNIMMEKRSNVKMAESILVPGNHKFWKKKKTLKIKITPHKVSIQHLQWKISQNLKQQLTNKHVKMYLKKQQLIRLTK
jgi:hypothetical protein